MLNLFAANVDVSFGKNKQVKEVDVVFCVQSVLVCNLKDFYVEMGFKCGGKSMGRRWASNGKPGFGPAGV